ncbi:MAG TPA: aspartate 1-decarboxylase [Candidatus Aminicenantes bacterium]|nr:aspartate 1-decarboxylase [Candidatus Aminicenantes bacterium]
MKRIMLKAKIHPARVTETDINYEGSLSLDEELITAADMLPYEKVHIYNVSNGERFSTYLIKGEKGSGKVGVFGAAARRARVGDTLIIVSYVILDEEETEFFMPKILLLGTNNKIAQIK